MLCEKKILLSSYVSESTNKGVNWRSKYVTQYSNKDLCRLRLLSPGQLYLCVVRVVINSLVCWSCTSALGLVLFQILMSQSRLFMSLALAVLSASTGFPIGQYRSYIGARATNSTSYSWSNGQAVAREGERESFWRPGSADSHVGEPCIHLNFSGIQPSGVWEDTRCNFIVNNVVCEFVP